MGWAITWCAVREENAEQFLNQLRLSPTGETEEFPESLISMAKLDTGWRVIWYNKYVVLSRSAPVGGRSVLNSVAGHSISI
jgi:hypothetical protein